MIASCLPGVLRTSSCPCRLCLRWITRHPGDHVLNTGRQSRCDGFLGNRPLGTAIRPGAGLQQMTSTSSDGSSVITLQFNLSLKASTWRAGSAAIHSTPLATFLPSDLPPHDLRQNQPRRYAHSDARADVQNRRAFQSGRLGRYAPRAQDSQLPASGLVSMSGGQKPAVRIQVNPTVIASYGLNMRMWRSVIWPPTSIRPKGISTRGPILPDRPMTSCYPPTTTGR